MKITMIVAVGMFAPFVTCAAVTNDVSHIRAALNDLDTVCATNQWNYCLCR